MIDVTVVIPMYNVEAYIERTILSLVNQNYDNMEIMVIDDGSTDNSVKIVEDLAQISKKINLIRLEKNGGVSQARNIGIQRASGKYLMFCDADDWYEKNAVEKFLRAVEEKDADFVMANYYISYDNKKVKVNTTGYFSNETILKKECVSYMTLTSCSKLIKRDLFLKNEIFYPIDVQRCEELTVIPVLAYLAQKPIILEDTLYNYYQRKNSASNTKIKDVTYFDETYKRFKSKIDNIQFKEELEFRAIEHLLYSKTLVMLKSKIKIKDVKKWVKEFESEYRNFRKNKYLKNFNVIKKIYIKTLNSKYLFWHRLFALLHEKITG